MKGQNLKRRPLGELELAIMDFVWARGGPTTVPDVHEHLTRSRKLAYTSTMTVMSRLFEKGLLKRNEKHRPYIYRPRLEREDYLAGLMVGVLSDVGDRRAALARFVERIGAKDAETLSKLLQEAKSRRK